MYCTENQTANPHIYEAGNMHEEWQNNFLTIDLSINQLTAASVQTVGQFNSQ